MAKRTVKTETKSNPISFRFSATTIHHLKVIAAFNKRSASNMVETLIEEAFDHLMEKHPENIKRIARDIKT